MKTSRKTGRVPRQSRETRQSPGVTVWRAVRDRDRMLSRRIDKGACRATSAMEGKTNVNYLRLKAGGLGLTHRWTRSVRDGGYPNLSNLMAGWLTPVASNRTAHQQKLV